MVVHMRHTRGHTRDRRSHHALTGGAYASCEKCGARTTRHTMCVTCGSYRGRVIIDMTAKVSAKTAKKKGKAAKATSASEK